MSGRGQATLAASRAALALLTKAHWHADPFVQVGGLGIGTVAWSLAAEAGALRPKHLVGRIGAGRRAEGECLRAPRRPPVASGERKEIAVAQPRSGRPPS